LGKAFEHNVEIHQIVVDFQKAYDSIRRVKLYVIMVYFGIPNKLIRLTKATMVNSIYHVKIGTNMTDGFKVGTGLKQGTQSLQYSTGICNKEIVGTKHINNIS
jgi:hypothetical protein